MFRNISDAYFQIISIFFQLYIVISRGKMGILPTYPPPPGTITMATVAITLVTVAVTMATVAITLVTVAA